MEDEELIPRNYQEKLISIAVKENSIIYLPTGSGKTFIAVCVLKELAKTAFQESYLNGGKISILLVNTVALVDQHTKYIQRNTPFAVGCYTGDMNVDFWDREKWLQEYNKNQILVMTSQIFCNTLATNFIDLDKVNLMIFDECHQAVECHAMRQIMMKFQDIPEESHPRVLGLTATLLNGNVKPHQVLQSVKTLETTYHGKVATVDEMKHVIDFSTNPRERIMEYKVDELTPVQLRVVEELRTLTKMLKNLKGEQKQGENKLRLKYLEEDKGYGKLAKLVMDAEVHVNMLGISGGQIAIICYIIHLECEKSLCINQQQHLAHATTISKFVHIKQMFEKAMSDTPPQIRFLKFCSPKVMKLIEILKTYPNNSSEELCCIIFVQRKNTAMFVYHILQQLIKTFDDMKHLKPDFIIGTNTNPLNSTKESLYYSKLNKKIVEKFRSKEINVIVASNVIEEGIDVPKCSLVIKFDTPTNYREYIQSKGRARHKNSLYYIMVDNENEKFSKNIQSFRNTERDLINYLVGQNENRCAPDESEVEKLYKETEPYYVNGPGSAHVTMLSAVQLLMLYCGSLQRDSYTKYEPIWYLDEKKDEAKYKVYVELPIICPLLEPVGGAFYDNKRDAKRSAAFLACILLHKCGAFNDHLLPVQYREDPILTQFLFTHWPEVREKDAGITKKRRIYNKNIPQVIQNPIRASQELYLHVIEITPNYEADVIEMDRYMLYNLYKNDLSFGFLTASPLSHLCTFPAYVSFGELLVTIKVNQAVVTLSQDDLDDLKMFHHTIFARVLSITLSKTYLVLGEQGKNMLLAPVLKGKEIDFDVVRNYSDVKCQTLEPSHEEKLALHVDEEGYKGKIVTPWYRGEDKQYIVLRVCEELNAKSPFPNSDYESYSHYFYDKYTKNTFNSKQPLLLVKPLSSRMNCLKPRGISKKRKKEETYEEMQLHLIPEMCVKQDFPSALWVQAKLLPTILHRTVQLLRTEELRSTIAVEGDLGVKESDSWEPLKVDVHLLNYQVDVPVKKETTPLAEDEALDCNELNGQDLIKSLANININKEFKDKMSDSEFPWTPDQEPTDVKRNLEVTKLDIEYYVKFLHSQLDPKEKANVTNNNHRLNRLAINFNRNFEHKPISLLRRKINPKGPELNAIYQTLCTAKCNDIVNLERLETLGDSFLKLVASLYIFKKFPNYTEGQATDLKGRLISNKNLYYLANVKKIGSLLKIADLDEKSEWLPPGYCVPELITDYIKKKEMSINSLFSIDIPEDEQLSGVLSKGTIEEINKEKGEVDDVNANNLFSSMCNYLSLQMVPDKTIADVSEALIGAYFEALGFEGGLKFMEWLNVIPPSENLLSLVSEPAGNPVINPKVNQSNLEFLLPSFEAQQVEKIIGYDFRNRAFLLQALTHTSYTKNRATQSYQRLEFIGDAVLDFLITTFIYESCGRLDPGDLTDLRSSLVNNEVFAAFVVKLGLHKYLKYFNTTLHHHVMKFVMYQENKNFLINDDVLILLNEDDLHIAENVDVPKVLGDLYESIVGAIYLDSGMDLNAVWKVVYKIMWEEIDLFSKNIPKNPIRMLSETLAPLTPVFHNTVQPEGDTVMVKLDFMLDGSLTRVHGFGENKKTAKKAAAKIALRLLSAGKTN